MNQNNYILVTNMYLNKEINAFTLGKKLMLEAKPMNLDSKISFPIIKNLPSGITMFLRVVRICSKFSVQKIKPQNNEVLQIDRFGHVLLKRQLNNISIDKSVYKIFDFDNNQIISQYDSRVKKEEMQQDIEKLEAVKHLKISPKLLELNYEQRYYIEEYLNLSHPGIDQWTISLDLIKDFINELYKSFSLTKISTKEYIDDINYHIKEDFIKNSLFSNKVNEISDYIKGKIRILETSEINSIILGQSHGDLNRTNFFLGKDKIIGIDWELLEYRPLYYDVFYFIIIVNRKNFNLSNEHNLNIETKSLIKYLNKQFKSETTLDYKSIELYLNCFILEYLSWKLRVYLTYKNDQDFMRRLNEILKDIDHYEKVSNDILKVFQ